MHTPSCRQGGNTKGSTDFPAKSAAPPPGTRPARPARAHADTPDTRIRTTRRHAQRAPPHTHTRGRQRPAASAGCRAGFRAISGLTERVVRSTLLARSPVGERGFLHRKKPIFRDVAILFQNIKYFKTFSTYHTNCEQNFVQLHWCSSGAPVSPAKKHPPAKAGGVFATGINQRYRSARYPVPDISGRRGKE